MAKYNVKFSCEHTIEKQLYGKESERSRYMAWAAESGSCPACSKANAAAETASKIESVEAEHSLPVLEGSEKQIAWARGIRADKIAAIAARMETYTAKAAAMGRQEEFDKQAAMVMQNLYGKTACRWWIDSREIDDQTMMQAAFKECMP